MITYWIELINLNTGELKIMRINDIAEKNFEWVEIWDGTIKLL